MNQLTDRMLHHATPCGSSSQVENRGTRLTAFPRNECHRHLRHRVSKRDTDIAAAGAAGFVDETGVRAASASRVASIEYAEIVLVIEVCSTLDVSR